MSERTANKLEETRLALQMCFDAMKHAQKHGCVDHLDCADDAGAFWYDALAAAEEALK